MGQRAKNLSHRILDIGRFHAVAAGRSGGFDHSVDDNPGMSLW